MIGFNNHVKIGIREREGDLINNGKDLTNLTSESDIALQHVATDYSSKSIRRGEQESERSRGLVSFPRK